MAGIFGGDCFLSLSEEKLTAIEISNMILHGLRHLNEEGDTNKNVLTEEEFEEIIGKTDANGNWLDEEPKEVRKPSITFKPDRWGKV